MFLEILRAIILTFNPNGQTFPIVISVSPQHVLKDTETVLQAYPVIAEMIDLCQTVGEVESVKEGAYFALGLLARFCGMNVVYQTYIEELLTALNDQFPEEYRNDLETFGLIMIETEFTECESFSDLVVNSTNDPTLAMGVHLLINFFLKAEELRGEGKESYLSREEMYEVVAVGGGSGKLKDDLSVPPIDEWPDLIS